MWTLSFQGLKANGRNERSCIRYECRYCFIEWEKLHSGCPAANLKKFRAFIDTCEVLGVNELIADTYSDIRLELKQKGKPLPENDIWIAATCLVHNVPLLSYDKHFLEIPQLSLIAAIEE